MAQVASLLVEAVRCQRQGDSARAEALCRQTLAIDPTHADALNLLGVLDFQAGRYQEAVASLGQAVGLRPENPAYHANLAQAYHAIGRHVEAVSQCREALRLRPTYPAAHNTLGNALLAQGQTAEACGHYEQALSQQPDFADAWNNLGSALRELGRYDESRAHLQRALDLRPNYPEALNNLGNTLRELYRPDEALRCYEEALRLRPGFAGARLNMANLLTDVDRWEEALPIYSEAVRDDPTNVSGHAHLGAVLYALGRVEEAEAALDEAVRLAPKTAAAWSDLGIRFSDLGRDAKAIRCFAEALHLDPNWADAHFGQALIWLRAGDFPRAWPEYEWRWRRRGHQPRDYKQPLWDGSALAGRTILLHAEQGMGDTLQHVRFAPLVQARGGRVVLACPPGLHSLLRRCAGIDALVGSDAELPAFDVHAPLLSVAGLLGTSVASVPAAVPYLHADPELEAKWAARLHELEGFKIGIVWQGGYRYGADRRRSAKLACFAPLARVPGVRLIGLQKGPARDQIADFAERDRFLDLGEELDETTGAFEDTAAVIRNLDLVITVDTAIGHLAGGLSAPVWIALAHAADSRWLGNRDDSPWYPTARLFRQERPGDWPGVFDRIAEALRRMTQPARV